MDISLLGKEGFTDVPKDFERRHFSCTILVGPKCSHMHIYERYVEKKTQMYR